MPLYCDRRSPCCEADLLALPPDTFSMQQHEDITHESSTRIVIQSAVLTREDMQHIL